MKQYYLFNVLYFCTSILIVYIWREEPLSSLLDAWLNLEHFSTFLLQFSAVMMLCGIIFSAIFKTRSPREVVTSVIFAFAGTVLLFTAFGLVKTTMPDIVAFYADPFFAEADKLMHGGVDPWVITHKLQQVLQTDWVSAIYLIVWMYPAALLPIFVAAFDTDMARVRRIVIVYISSWVIVGNVLALAGMSVGPVFYDRLLGTERFSELTDALFSSGVAQGNIGAVQAHLWDSYVANTQSLNIGISAFPSVHVAVAAVVAVYLGMSSRLLWPIGIAFVIVTLFLSVYSGYHYAVDGYVSILIVLFVWRWSEKR